MPAPTEGAMFGHRVGSFLKSDDTGSDHEDRFLCSVHPILFPLRRRPREFVEWAIGANRKTESMTSCVVGCSGVDMGLMGHGWVRSRGVVGCDAGRCLVRSFGRSGA